LVGAASDRNDNRITVAGGSFVVTNAGGSASVNFVRGTNLLSSGTMTVDNLFLTNGANSIFVFNGGNLNVKFARVQNNTNFVIGDGVSSAAMTFLASGPVSQFSVPIIVSSNGSA